MTVSRMAALFVRMKPTRTKTTNNPNILLLRIEASAVSGSSDFSPKIEPDLIHTFASSCALSLSSIFNWALLTTQPSSPSPSVELTFAERVTVTGSLGARFLIVQSL